MRKLGTALGCPDLRTIYAEITAHFLSTQMYKFVQTLAYKHGGHFQKCTRTLTTTKRARIQRAVERGVAAHRIAFHEAAPA